MRRREFIAGLALPFLVRAASAQQYAGVYRIAVVHPSIPVSGLNENNRDSVLIPAFLKELRLLGYIEGQNLLVERRSAEGRPELYDQIARDVIDLKPGVVFVNSSRMALAFRNLTSTVPIVMNGTDPVGLGLATSLSHPGQNLTGFADEAGAAGVLLHGKQFQLLKEMIPALKKLGVLAPRVQWEQTPFAKSVFETAQSAGIAVIGPPVESPMQEQDFRASLNAMTGKIDALLLSFASESLRHRPMILQFAQEQNVPALYTSPLFVREGGLMSYAPDFGQIGKGVARYVDLILKGANAGDLPIELPVKFDFIINLKTAKALGLTVPPSLLASADEVIE